MSEYTEIKTKDCSLTARVLCDGWTILEDDEGNKISLGRYPNKRFEIVRMAQVASFSIKEKKGCGKEIMVRDGKSQHQSFCGCTYRGLHLCDSCSIKDTSLGGKDE